MLSPKNKYFRISNWTELHTKPTILIVGKEEQKGENYPITKVMDFILKKMLNK